jgi:hypothetical protein
MKCTHVNTEIDAVGRPHDLIYLVGRKRICGRCGKVLRNQRKQKQS